MTGRIKSKIKSEHGVVQIVEAAFIFPIMFMILFILIYMGNAFYIKAQVDGVVETRAIEGANYCADPMLQTIKDNDGRIPFLEDIKIEPYRCIFGDKTSVENKIATEVQNDIEGNTISFFNNMKPELKTSKSNIAKFQNYVVYSTFSVEVKYELKVPMKLWGDASPTVMTIHSRAEVPVNDTVEFIRNTDMVVDLFHKTKIGQSVSAAFGKINTFISNFAGK